MIVRWRKVREFAHGEALTTLVALPYDVSILSAEIRFVKIKLLLCGARFGIRVLFLLRFRDQCFHSPETFSLSRMSMDSGAAVVSSFLGCGSNVHWHTLGL